MVLGPGWLVARGNTVLRDLAGRESGESRWRRVASTRIFFPSLFYSIQQTQDQMVISLKNYKAKWELEAGCGCPIRPLHTRLVLLLTTHEKWPELKEIQRYTLTFFNSGFKVLLSMAGIVTSIFWKLLKQVQPCFQLWSVLAIRSKMIWWAENIVQIRL